jgi:hypothetical protein
VTFALSARIAGEQPAPGRMSAPRRKQERGNSVAGLLDLLAGIGRRNGEHNLACALDVTDDDPGLATIGVPDPAKVARPVCRV